MKDLFKKIFRLIAEILATPVKRYLLLIVILALVAVTDFLILGLARRTFVFYTISDGVIAVEDRMLKHSQSRENDIIRYVEEALLGPVAQDLLPLFPRGTRLKSLLYRNGVVFADFTELASLPPIEGGRTLENFRTLYDSILRNFSYVREVRFFIEGNAIFIEEFLQWAEGTEDGAVGNRHVFSEI
jgi:hypothetical protein